MNDSDYCELRPRKGGSVSIEGATLYLNADGEIVSEDGLGVGMGGPEVGYLLQGRLPSATQCLRGDDLPSTPNEVECDKRTAGWLRKKGYDGLGEGILKSFVCGDPKFPKRPVYISPDTEVVRDSKLHQ